MNITTATPAEIDTIIAELDWQAAKIEARVAGAEDGIAYRKNRLRREPTEQMLAELADLQAQAAAARKLIEPYDAEFSRRGGWTRFFMVMNNGGHLHSSTRCSTCRRTTQFAWMPQYSGSNEAEIVDLAGEDACTVCFPDAPVSQQSRLPFRVEEREAADKARAEREAKKAKAAADLIPYGTRPSQSFKTLRSAENEAGRIIGYAVGARWQSAHDAEHRVHLDKLAAEYTAEARAIVAAIEAARPGYDGAALVAKKVAKEAKELRKYGHYTVPAEPTL